MAFENIFQKIENTTRRQQCTLKPVTSVWEQISKDQYKDKVTGKILSRRAFQRLHDSSSPGTFIVKLLSQPTWEFCKK
jgi:hypothetical protein